MLIRQELLEARRTRGEFEAAKNAYDKTRQKLGATLETWGMDGQEQLDKSHKQLQNAYALVFVKQFVKQLGSYNPRYRRP